MATRKQSSGSTKSTSTSKSAKNHTSAGKAAAKSGPVPPYGVAIKEAIARGEVQEMRKLAVTTRKWLKDVQKALGSLEKAIEKRTGK